MLALSCTVPVTTTAHFQLRLKPVTLCTTWVVSCIGKWSICSYKRSVFVSLFVCFLVFFFQDENRDQKEVDIVSAVVQSVQGDCSCNFTEANIQNFEFSCRSIENTVVFRAEIVYTAFGEDLYTADVLVALVSTWAQSGTSISVDSTRLDVDPSCPTQLESFQAGDCETTGDSFAALGGAIGAVCVLLIVIGIIIMIVILVRRRRKQKQFR